MPTFRKYRDFVMAQLVGLVGVSCRAMMGEYLLYYRGKLVGGLYDNRLLVKPVASSRVLLPDAEEVRPYEGASPLLLVEGVENGEFLGRLLGAMEPELPVPRARRIRPAEEGRKKP